MNNRLLLFFVLVALLLAAALPDGIAYASGKTATLLEFKHVPAKGWTAIFAITGKWTNADLKGNSITVGGKTYNLYCSFKDDNHVSCTMHHDMGQLINKPATLFFGGQSFSHGVPKKSAQCRAWQAGFEYYYEEGEWMEMYLASIKTYTEWWQYAGWAEWGTVTYGPDTLLDPEYFFLNVDNDYTSWTTFFGTSYIETEAYEVEGFGYYDQKCASWTDEYTGEASYQYQGWAEWAGEGLEVCVGSSCVSVEEHEYESCEAEDGSCFDESGDE